MMACNDNNMRRVDKLIELRVIIPCTCIAACVPYSRVTCQVSGQWLSAHEMRAPPPLTRMRRSICTAHASFSALRKSEKVYYHAHKSKEAALRTTFMPTLELDDIWLLLFIIL